MDFNQEYILCAAIKRKDAVERKKLFNGMLHNNDIAEIEIGYRHCDIFRRFTDILSKKPNDQGFYTSKGRFVNRKEGMIIAKNCGQVSKEHLSENLYSEDLY